MVNNVSDLVESESEVDSEKVAMNECAKSRGQFGPSPTYERTSEAPKLCHLNCDLFH